MHHDYVWINGIPYGVGEGNRFKIVSDPYRKRISLEEYAEGLFIRVIYDSALLNFRHLNPVDQMAWEKKEVGDKSFIRDQDDRLLYIEDYTFAGKRCRGCKINSPHGLLLATSRMYYEDLGDSFNGVILYDVNEKAVLQKRYRMDEQNSEFGELIAEERDSRKIDTAEPARC